MVSDKIEPIGGLEKLSGMARLLLFLHPEGSGSMSWMTDTSKTYPNVGYSAAGKLTEPDIITVDFDPKATYRTRELQLTEKGSLIANRLYEINVALSS